MVQLLCPARQNILFDLDGTLLPMDMERYIQLYFGGLAEKMQDLAPEVIHKMLWEGIIAMMKNNGPKTNREVFAEVFTARTGRDYYAGEKDFDSFYQTLYQRCLDACQPTELAAKIVDTLQKKGYTVVIATSPLYPAIAAQSRVRWAGLDKYDFPLVTTFDDFHTAKPNPNYYLEVCEKLHVKPEECIMVGNDAEEDGAARAAGMDVILVTDCLINKKNLPLEGFYPATLADVLAWAESLPASV